ncbi:MAG: hypothetical protein ABIK28_05470 [Planctomycetota bacterium]
MVRGGNPGIGGEAGRGKAEKLAAAPGDDPPSNRPESLLVTGMLTKYCSQCGEEKEKGEFRMQKTRISGARRPSSWCKKCSSKDTGEYYKRHPDIRRAQRVKEINDAKREGWPDVLNLKDKYIKVRLKKSAIPITSETIEIKRQQITMKRTLKQFKKWREENESNRKVISGEQCEDVPVNAIA